jgi:hypothetical protein
VKESEESSRVAIITQMVTIVTNLSITELLCQIIAKVPCLVEITDGLAFVGSRGNQDFVTHEWFV